MSTASDEFKKDYRSTVFLPTTEFPMRGDLPNSEPKLLEYWEQIQLYQKLRRKSKGSPTFVLHDGPPYANGNIHIGHALNKILKDVINRAKQMSGCDAHYIPGWDCHGLPIEWQIEEQYKKQGKNKNDVDVLTFRNECRTYAEKWLQIQKEEFKRLGVLADWDNAYTTMTPAAEAAIYLELSKFLLNGQLYRGSKPVMWSPVEQTALAEAETEYMDRKSTAVWVKFPIHNPSADVEGVSLVAWTTTPWTLPGNRAVAYGADVEYSLISVSSVVEGSMMQAGERLLLATNCLERFIATAKIQSYTVDRVVLGFDLSELQCRHPLFDLGYKFIVPVLAGDFVTDDAGSGFVHIAPGHGEDDWRLGQANGLEVPETVGPDGRYLAHLPLVGGLHVYNMDQQMLGWLGSTGVLVAKETITHSYPHSWRSKAPLIMRNTPQWFISMNQPGDLRATALSALDDINFIPSQGKTRLSSMVANRPDWCVSRQRTWGVPIAFFINKCTGEPLVDSNVIDRTADLFAEHGADAWWKFDSQVFLGDKYDANDYEKVYDIVDIWFESGATHAFVLGQNHLSWPADLYLEGSDQHRGWFQSSLLESCGTRGEAPFDAVLTHGFVLDEHGRKMSKSQGNVTAPQTVISQYGADILRLWVMNSNYTEDLRIGKELLKQQVDIYRKIRNTFRWLLGALKDFNVRERMQHWQMPSVDQYMLHRLAMMHDKVVAATESYNWQGLVAELHEFCANELSAFYFDLVKDTLYCDSADSPRRKSARTVLYHIFNHLTGWFSPVLVFTMEEVWRTRFPNEDSIHLYHFELVPGEWRNPELAETWDLIKSIRSQVLEELEAARRDGVIGASLQARVELCLPEFLSPPNTIFAALSLEQWKELLIVSEVEVYPVVEDAVDYGIVTDPLDSVEVRVFKAEGHKCERCWHVLPSVNQNQILKGELVCDRCLAVI
jgi:isoleucyl-tRNA synthetase